MVVMSRKQSHDDASLFLEYDIHIPTRTLYIGSVSVDTDGDEGGVDFMLSERVIKGLHLLDSVGTDKPINIILNNPGGDEVEGLAIYDAIKSCQNHITITVFGKVWSMSGYLLQGADERIMHKHSSFMLHEGYVGYGSNHPRIVQKWIDYYKKIDKILFSLYLEKIQEKQPKFTAKKLEDMLKFDTILTPQEAIDLNLCDKIAE
jgi:ATP-dependent protease ClpP protease subunit